jgi:molybdopterin-guanine dinucleotide biosynthesis protein A
VFSLAFIIRFMSEHNILGAILAGGQSKRMGKDKLFLELNNKKLIEHTIDKVKKYLKEVIIVTSQENEFFSKNNLTTVKDCIKGQLGPLVGILTAMKWAKENLTNCSWIATFPCDTPFFPESIIKDFIKESKKRESLILCASSHGRKHNIFGLWSLDLYDKLREDLINAKIRKVQDWTEKNKIKNLEFKFKDYDPFFNINTLEDLKFAKKLSIKIKNENK